MRDFDMDVEGKVGGILGKHEGKKNTIQGNRKRKDEKNWVFCGLWLVIWLIGSEQGLWPCKPCAQGGFSLGRSMASPWTGGGASGRQGITGGKGMPCVPTVRPYSGSFGVSFGFQMTITVKAQVV